MHSSTTDPAKAWEEVPEPTLVDDTDAIVRVDAVTICGTDLHILKGDVPTVTPGRILGHEAVGTIESVGAGVKTRKPGDRVLVSCITACGACRYCREGSYGQCLGGGGWILGHKIDGTQAEFVRVPFADTSTHLAPDGRDRRAAADARRHPADGLRGRRAQRTGPAGRRGRRGRRRADRPLGDHGRSLVQPEPRRRHRPRRQPPRRGQAVRRRRHVNNGREDAWRSSELTGGSGRRHRRGRRGPATFELAPRSCDPAATSPTSACTEDRRPCTSRSCGSRT